MPTDDNQYARVLDSYAFFCVSVDYAVPDGAADRGVNRKRLIDLKDG